VLARGLSFEAADRMATKHQADTGHRTTFVGSQPGRNNR
jgi:hypothetical protein